MKSLVRKFVPLAVVAVSGACWSSAQAQCGIPEPLSQKQSWQEYGSREAGSFTRVADWGRDRDERREEAIVGFWRFVFTSQGSSGIPDGTVIDKGFAQWHSDGTEITNSLRPPSTSNFCLGTWKKVGASAYTLNHFALSWDAAGAFMGIANIRENVAVSRDRASFSGSFTVDQYDTAGNVLAHAQGSITGQRITISTRFQDLT